jgi:hypothetical protein
MADAMVHSFTQSPLFYFLSFHNLDPIIYTSVNPVHNAPVEQKKKKRSGQFNWHRKQNPSKKEEKVQAV